MRLALPQEQYDAQLLSQKTGRAHGLFERACIPHTGERGSLSLYEHDSLDAVQDEAELLKLEAKLVAKPEHPTQHQEDNTGKAGPLCTQSAEIYQS